MFKGYKAIADWAKSLRSKARERFRCRRINGSYRVRSEYIIRDCLIRIDPVHLDRALQRWNQDSHPWASWVTRPKSAPCR